MTVWEALNAKMCRQFIRGLDIGGLEVLSNGVIGIWGI